MYFAILVNLSTSFLLSPFFTEKIIISPFYFPHGGRTSSDPNWPLRTHFLLYYLSFLFFFFFTFLIVLRWSNKLWPKLAPQNPFTAENRNQYRSLGRFRQTQPFYWQKTNFNERRLEPWKKRGGIQPSDAALALFFSCPGRTFLNSSRARTNK